MIYIFVLESLNFQYFSVLFCASLYYWISTN